MCSWSSNTNRSRGGAFGSPPRAGRARRGRRRRTARRPRSWRESSPPRRRRRRGSGAGRGRGGGPTLSARSAMRCSTRFCSAVCGIGMCSPLETMRVGTGEWRWSTSSARASFESCSSLSQTSSSRSPRVVIRAPALRRARSRRRIVASGRQRALRDNPDPFAQPAFLFQALHQPAAATCLPGNSAQPPVASVALPWNSWQFEHF